jgi:predicted small secreted protein
MEMIADTGRIGSLDIVELNPAFDEHNRTGKLAVDLIESLFGKSPSCARPRPEGAAIPSHRRGAHEAFRIEPVAAACLFVAPRACNTVEGFGKDVKKVGQKVEEAAK